MAIFDFTDYDEEKKKKKPSQIAKEEVATEVQKKKISGQIFDFSDYKPRKVEAPVTPIEPKKQTFLEKVKQFVAPVTKVVTGFFAKPAEPTLPTVQIPETFKQAQDSYLKFPSFFPNPDFAQPQEAMPSAQMTPAGRDAVQKFWSAPIDNSLNATRDFLTYHPMMLNTLAVAQQITEETPLVGINKNPLTRGITKGVADTFLGSSQQAKDTFDKRLNHSVTWYGKTFETVGQVIGGLLSYVAGGIELKSLGFAKATLPVLFATLGQTSAPPETTIAQRIEKIPVDVIAGYLFSKVPQLRGFNPTALKGLSKITGVVSGQTIANTLIEGERDPKKIAEMVAYQALIMSLFHITGSAMGFLGDEILNSKVKTGNQTFAPEEIRNIVHSTKYEGTKFGDYLLNLAKEAESSGKNINIDMTAMQKTFASKALNLNKPEGININATLVEKNATLPSEEKAIVPQQPVKPVEPSTTIIAPTGKEIVPTKPKEKVQVAISEKKPPLKPITEPFTQGQQIKMLQGMKSGTGKFEVGEVYTQVGKPEANKIIIQGKDAEGNILGNYIHKNALSPATFKPEELKPYTVTEEAKAGVLKGFGITKAPKAEKVAIPKELEPLAQEARKYKSVEEFVGAWESGKLAQGLEITLRTSPTAKEDFARAWGILSDTPEAMTERRMRDLSKLLKPEELSSKEAEVLIEEEIKRLYKRGQEAGYQWAKKPLSSNKARLEKQAISNVVGERAKKSMQLIKEKLTDFYTQVTKGVEVKEKQDIKELDAQIRTIKEPTEENPEWEVEIGLQESLGEQGGDILTQTYDTKPTLLEIKNDIIEEYKRTKAEINKEVAMGITAKSGRDELIEGAIDKVLVGIKAISAKPTPPSPTKKVSPVQARKPTPPSPELDLVKEALFSNDEAGAKALYKDIEGEKPSFESIKSEIETYQENELSSVKSSLGDTASLLSDNPNKILADIATRLGKHFKAPKSLFKITGRERTYTTPQGLKLTVGGDQTKALDNLIFSTDIDGFSKNMEVLAYKFDKTFNEIYASIKSGDIDGADYESFKQRFADIIATRPTYAKRPGEPVEVKPKIKGEKPSPKAPEPVSLKPGGVKPRVSPYATTGQAKIGDFEKVAPERSEANNFKLFDKVKVLTDKYAKIVGESYTPRGALGVYYPDTTNLRINGMNNLSVATHEITHFLDHHYSISEEVMKVVGTAINGNPIYERATLPIRKELTDLYMKYYPGARQTKELKVRMSEGLATLLQKYTEMPTTIKNEYPGLVKEFLEVGGKYYKPVMGEIITDLKDIVKEYQGLDSLDKIGARVTSNSVNINKKDFLSLGEKVRTFIADNIYPVEILAKRAGVHFTKNDPSLWVRFYNNSNQIIFNNIYGKKGFWGFRNGEVTKIYDYNFKTLIDGLVKEKTMDSFSYYLVARDQHFNYQELDNLETRVKELAQQVKHNKRNFELLKEYKEVKNDYLGLKTQLQNNGFTKPEVDSAYLENKDRFIGEEKMYDSLVREDINFLSSEEVQLVTLENKDRLLNKEGYASLKRQFYDEIVGEIEYTGAARVGKTKVSALFRRKGSSRIIINPVYSAITNHAEATKKGLKQIVYNKIGKIANSAFFPELFQTLQLKVVPQDNGMLTFPQEKDPNIIMARVDYKRVPILSDNVIKRTIDEVLTHQNISVFEQLLLGTSRFFTKGTTGLFPQFALANYAVDQTTASAQTMNNYIPIYTPLKELSKAVQDRGGDTSKFFIEYMVLGGEKQTFVGWQDLSPNELFSRIAKEKNGLIKVLDLINKGTDILAIPSKYSEIATRASEFIKSRQSGKPQIVALEEAGRVTAPFHHIGRLGGGRIGQTFVKSIPFFNPAIQVLDQGLRMIQSPTGRKRYGFVVLAVTAALISSFVLLMQKGSKEQKELYTDLEADELSKYIWFPNPLNKEQLIKIRIPEQMGIIGLIINMTLANQILNANYTFGDFVEAGTSFLPQQFNITNPVRALMSWIPQILKPAIMTIAGIKDYPKVIPMESQTLRNLPPKYRYTESTSWFAKLLGDKLNVSPIKIDYLVTGYFGRASGFLMGKKGVYNPFSSVIRNYYFSSGRRISNYYDLKEKNDQIYKEIIPNEKGKVIRKAPLTEKLKVKRIKNQTDNISDLLSDYRKLDIEKEPKKAARLREKILIQLEKLDSIIEKNKISFNPFIETVKSGIASIKLPKLVGEVYASDGLEDTAKKLVWTKDIRTGWEKFLGKVQDMIPGEQRLEKPIEGITVEKLNTEEKRMYYTSMLSLRKADPDWYYKNVGNKVEKRILGFDLGSEKVFRESLIKEAEIKTKPVPTITEPEATETPYNDTIKEVFGDKWVEATKVLKRTDADGVIRGENVQLKSGKEVDIGNRLDENGKWDSTKPIATFKNKFTGEIEENTDRGLFRINNVRLFGENGLLGGAKERLMMIDAGILDESYRNYKDITPKMAREAWDKMLDPENNIKMAKILYDLNGNWDAWVAAPDEWLSDKRKKELGKI